MQLPKLIHSHLSVFMVDWFQDLPQTPKSTVAPSFIADPHYLWVLHPGIQPTTDGNKIHSHGWWNLQMRNLWIRRTDYIGLKTSMYKWTQAVQAMLFKAQPGHRSFQKRSK